MLLFLLLLLLFLNCCCGRAYDCLGVFFVMMPGINPRQMRQVMKRMGIKQEEVDASEVIIRLKDKEIVISNPQVSRVNMMGQDTWQVVGDSFERPLDTKPSISDDDVRTVMAQAGVDEEAARKAIDDANGDLAEAILNLQSRSS